MGAIQLWQSVGVKRLKCLSDELVLMEQLHDRIGRLQLQRLANQGEWHRVQDLVILDMCVAMGPWAMRPGSAPHRAERPAAASRWQSASAVVRVLCHVRGRSLPARSTRATGVWHPADR